VQWLLGHSYIRSCMLKYRIGLDRCVNCTILLSLSCLFLHGFLSPSPPDILLHWSCIVNVPPVSQRLWLTKLMLRPEVCGECEDRVCVYRRTCRLSAGWFLFCILSFFYRKQLGCIFCSMVHCCWLTDGRPVKHWCTECQHNIPRT